jgi:hypothetical protein
MTQTLITPCLAVLVGIFSTGFAITYPSLDQYLERNHYQTPQFELQSLRNEGTLLKDLSASNVIIRKQIIERWPPVRVAFDNGKSFQNRNLQYLT